MRYIVASFILLLSLNSHATDVKCFIKLDNNVQHVAYYYKLEQSAKQWQDQLVGQFIFEKDGTTKRFIDKVMECVNQNRAFTSAYARKLDELTPR